MTLHGNVNILDPYAYTIKDFGKIFYFDFIGESTTSETEKVVIDETFCTLVLLGEKYLQKNSFQKTIKKIDDIRRIIRLSFLIDIN